MTPPEGKRWGWAQKIADSIGDDLRRAKEARGSGGSYTDAGRPSGNGGFQLVPFLADKRDPYPWLMASHAFSADHQHRMVMGTRGDGQFVYTNPRRNLLILGPPRSDKTAGVLIPLILSAVGPVVSTSTKDDVLRATGLARGRLGTVWHYGPDGGSTPPGTRPLRWSPIDPSRDWGRAIGLGKAIAQSSRKSKSAGGSNEEFFADRAAAFIAAMFHAAAIGEKPMQWVLKATAGNEKVIAEAIDILNDALEPNASLAADSLEGIANQDPRTKTAIMATAEVALSVYRLPGALATTEGANFDAMEFVRGRPDERNIHRSERLTPASDADTVGRMESYRDKGFYDTIYITASGSQQSLVAPLVAGLLTEIREAAFTQHRADEADSYYGRPPTIWALDELASLPMQDLPETLTQCAGQNLLVASCVQDLGLLEGKWDAASETFLTLFGDLVIHPGIRHTKTLDALSSIIGQHWVTYNTSSTNQGQTWGRENSRQNSETYSTNQQLVPILPQSVIHQGPGDHPDRVLHMRGQQWQWAFCMPYYKAPPWPQVLTGSIEYAGHQSGLESRWGMPFPELDRDRNGQLLLQAGGISLQRAHYDAMGSLERYRQRRRQVVPSLRAHPLLEMWDETDVIDDLEQSEDVWFVSPAALDRGRLEGLVRECGFVPVSGDAAKVKWYEVDGVREEVVANWIVQVEEARVMLRRHDPAVPVANNNVGRLWRDNLTLARIAERRGQPRLMLQAFVLDTIGIDMMFAFLVKLGEHVPVAMVISDQKLLTSGDWGAHGGFPREEELFSAEEIAAANQVPEPERLDERPHYMGEMGFVSLNLTNEDFQDQSRLNARIEDFVRRTGHDPREDDR